MEVAAAVALDYSQPGKPRRLDGNCLRCHADLTGMPAQAIYCSNRCSDGANKARRRAAGEVRKPIGRKVRHAVFVRDGWKCQICGVEVNLKALYPAPDSATIDHIVPLVKGGTDELGNLQTAHARCNFLKHDADMEGRPDDAA